MKTKHHSRQVRDKIMENYKARWGYEIASHELYSAHCLKIEIFMAATYQNMAVQPEWQAMKGKRLTTKKSEIHNSSRSFCQQTLSVHA